MKPLSSDEVKLCQLQAKLFEDSIDMTGCSSAVFIRRFMFSDIALSFDDKTYLLHADSNEKVFASLIEQFGDSEYGSLKYTSDQMFWIGYVYRCFSIVHDLSSKQVYRMIDARKIVEYYNIYHTYDIVDATQRIAENIGYQKENIEEKALRYMKKLIIRDKLKSLLNKEITVYVDRPIGSRHPEHEELEYKVNYGYIKEVRAADKEYQDAYILGENKPLKKFTGIVIGIVARKTDDEDKLIVCDAQKKYTNAQIRKMIDFQEKYHEYKVIRNN